MSGPGAAAVFAALGDPVRQRLLDLLAAGPATASQLHPAVGITRQAVAQQLAVLQDAGLVSRQRHGREVRFAVVPAGLAPAREHLDRLGAAWEDHLAAIKRAAEGYAAGAGQVQGQGR
ncbi:ArsR/SmtB family transcription factor [Arthrobacter sp. JSM 101049]|uniref:ArsR/SmtB family transcription factor n=1 Tax=Arthrobacter sp. JSM 101049 TaxID=929097 RepID=UPI003561969B